MTEPSGFDTDLMDRLESTLAATASPLSLAAQDPVELMGDEIGLHDARFDEPLIVRASRLESMLSTRSMSEVTAGMENLSAAYVIADKVESATWDSTQPIQGASCMRARRW